MRREWVVFMISFLIWALAISIFYIQQKEGVDPKWIWLGGWMFGCLALLQEVSNEIWTSFIA